MSTSPDYTGVLMHDSIDDWLVPAMEKANGRDVLLVHKKKEPAVKPDSLLRINVFLHEPLPLEGFAEQQPRMELGLPKRSKAKTADEVLQFLAAQMYEVKDNLYSSLQVLMRKDPSDNLWALYYRMIV